MYIKKTRSFEMRLKNIFRNSSFSLLSQFVLITVGFFSQRVMNFVMGEALIGMNSVISNIIAILSVSELGIASAIAFHLYEALAIHDEEKIVSLMNLYRRAYFIFAAVIAILGTCIMPFVHLFLKENVFSLSYVRFIYMLWLIRTVLSYLLSYKKSLLIADQKEYIVSIVTLTMNLLNYGAIIIIIMLFQNYQLALSLNIIIEAILNIWIIRYVNKKYPFLRQHHRLSSDKNTIDMLLKDIKNIFISRLASKLLVSTDNLILSSFISVAIVGRYANYSMIIQSVMNVALALSNTLQPSIGNMFTDKDADKNYQVLRQITFLFFLLASICSAGSMSLMTRFVTDFWLSDSYRLEPPVVICCVINLFLFLISLPITAMISASGMFEKERNISILYASVNLVLSLLLVKPLGITGVLLGTSASYLVQIVFRIYIFFRFYLQKNTLKYIADILQYGILTFVQASGTYYVITRIYLKGNFSRLVLAVLICIFLPGMINLLIFFKSWRLQSIARMAKSFINPKK